MRKILFVGILWTGLAGAAHAEWVNISHGLDEADIQFVTAGTRDLKTLFAASNRHLYKSVDEGKSWKRVLSIRGETHKIHFVFIDPSYQNEIYVATDQGVRVSHESGKKWEVFFSGVGEESKRSFCVAAASQMPDEIYIGTAKGLFSVNKRTHQTRRINGLPSEAVYSIFIKQDKDYEAWAATEKGIYKSRGDLNFWQRVYVNPKENETPKEASLEQFNIEEVFTGPFFSNLTFLVGRQRLYAGTQQGILGAPRDTGSWVPEENQSFPDRKVNALACSADSLYAATDQGVFQSNPESHAFVSLNEGLESKEVRHIFYNPGGDYLIAATKRGVFRYIYPELKPEAVALRPQERSLAGEEALKFFQNEPVIREIHEAAIRYAEVHPDKIENWRRAAALKALLPTVSVDTGVSTDENIDLDRGGTNDPDKFIKGPSEQSYDWSVGLNWDLGDLVWNNDQTSIDTRSKLMVELRDDILNEVTHLYYERRRLQVEMALSSSREFPIQIEKQIRLEELTAGIDALTGGYFSKHLDEIRS